MIRRTNNFFFSRQSQRVRDACISGLHLKDRLEQVFGDHGEKLDFRVGVEAVEVGRFLGQTLVNEGVVALVVCVRRNWKAWSKVQLTIQLFYVSKKYFSFQF